MSRALVMANARLPTTPAIVTKIGRDQTVELLRAPTIAVVTVSVTVASVDAIRDGKMMTAALRAVPMTAMVMVIASRHFITVPTNILVLATRAGQRMTAAWRLLARGKKVLACAVVGANAEMALASAFPFTGARTASCDLALVAVANRHAVGTARAVVMACVCVMQGGVTKTAHMSCALQTAASLRALV